MPFQSSVNVFNALGIPGDIAFSGPIRAQSANLYSAGQAQTVGFAFTASNAGADPDPVSGAPNAGNARVGGTGTFAGILVNPKAYATNGGAQGPLSPSLNLPDYSVGELLIMGEIFVVLAGAANVGDLVYFDNTTGALGAQAPSSSFTGVVATNTLTVSGFVAGGAPLGVGTVIAGTGVTPGTVISALGSGTGGNGTYTVTGAATVGSTAMTGNSIAPAGKTFIPNCVVFRYGVAGAGVAVIKLTN